MPILYMLGKGGISVLQTSIFNTGSVLPKYFRVLSDIGLTEL